MGDDGSTLNLELMRTDYTALLREACQAFVAAAETMQEAMDSGTDGIGDPDSQPRIDRSLVRMVLAVHQAARLIIPPPDAMEYFGLPRSVTASGMNPEPTVRVQDPGRESWDFRPWLSEKLSRLRDNLLALIETVELVLEQPPDGSNSSRIEDTDANPAVPPAPTGDESCPPSRSGDESRQTGSTLQEADQSPGENPAGENLRRQLTERAGYELRASRGYARDILNAMEAMGLSVIDWRITGG